MSKRAIFHVAVATVLSVGATVSASAEYQCAPTGANPQLATGDQFFSSEVEAWSKYTKSRPLEGDPAVPCPDVTVPGYEGFPTKRCSYSDADAGPIALHAEAIVLNPSARQLASWSVSACRTNGASDAAMPKCLKKLRGQVLNNDTAQFPVVGSVVESYCNSGSHGPCDKLEKSSHWRLARHTWFRDGVAVYYSKAQGAVWEDTPYGKATFDAVLDVSRSDANISSTRNVARIGGAIRAQWSAWRHHIGKPEMPDGQQGSTEGNGWRTVTAAVHKAACKGASNELFDAVVFSNPAWTKP